MATSAPDLVSEFSKLSLKRVPPIESSIPESPYRYRSLQPNHIRLLSLLPQGENKNSYTAWLECEFVEVSLDHAGQYEALSYVTESLFTALWHLRYAKEPRCLWADQLCIAQDDNAEKEAQVRLMGEIYSKASCTIVWLGAQSHDAELMHQMYKKLSRLLSNTDDSRGVLMLDQQAVAEFFGTSYKDESNDPTIGGRRKHLERFLNLPWFRRTWVYQEAVVAPRVDMVWGDVVLPLDFVIGLVVSVYSIAKNAEEGDWHKRIKNTRGFAPVRTIYHDRKAHRKKELNSLDVLWHARKHLDTTDPRDYVFAFLAVNKYIGASSEPSESAISLLQDQITPSYQDSVEVVYKNLARTAVRGSCSLDILQYVVPTKGPDQTYSLPTWVPNWADRRFICGSPIFVPGVPTHLSACRDKPYALTSTNSNQLELIVSGHKLGSICTIVRHSFKHTYFSPTLKEAYQLKEIQKLLETQVKHLSRKRSGRRVPDWFVDNPRETLLRTILADGSFTAMHKILHPIADLLRAYDNEDGTRSAEDAKRDVNLRYYLRQTGEVASGKRVFLTGDLDIGLGFSTIKKGDIVCILYGSKTPCILRKDSSQDRYTFVGLCFLHGWMDGTRNPRNWDWWDQTPEIFILR